LSEFEEAGPSQDLHDAYLASMIEQRSSRGRRLLARSRFLVEAALAEKDVEDGERFARDGLRLLARALDWAEDSPAEAASHEALDSAGAWVRETFGCQFAQEGGNYYQRCPVALAHTRVGFSVGGVVARRTCSLCGGDVAECSHRRDRAYLVPGGSGGLGWCRVCLERGPCEHVPSATYRARVVAIIAEMTLDEVSFVGKPANPEARLESVSVSFEGLRDRHGQRFERGMTVNCDRCLTPCEGLIRPEGLHT